MDHNKKFLERQIAELFRLAQMNFGRAVRSCWLHDEPDCPGCGRDISPLNFKGKQALSLNAFMYRPEGVLIGYLLCGDCAGEIFRDARRSPFRKTEIHSRIEANLIKAYASRQSAPPPAS